MARETIIIDRVRYCADPPRSCRGCFFRKNRIVGCTLKMETIAEKNTWANRNGKFRCNH